MTLEQAKKANVCRICERQPGALPPGEELTKEYSRPPSRNFRYNFGREHAHEFCLDNLYVMEHGGE